MIRTGSWVLPQTLKNISDCTPGGTHLGALQELILKRGEDSKRICTSVEFFVDWLAN